MYHWIEDEQFLKDMRYTCADVVNQLKIRINNGDYLEVDANLVGSGARDLETQNANEPVDLDYNVNIISIDGSTKEKNIKEYIRKEFNKVLNKMEWGDCSDKTSVLSTPYKQLENGNKTKFKIDLGIIKEDKKTWYRMQHEHTGNTKNDRWYWNEGPDSKGLNDRVIWIKAHNHYNDVKEAYLDKKNLYLRRNDKNHPSFNCYIEAVNEIYEKYQSLNNDSKKATALKKQEKKVTEVKANLFARYSDDSKKYFYCGYQIEGSDEKKSQECSLDVSPTEIFKFIMHWLDKLITEVNKTKNVRTIIVSTSEYIYDMLISHRINDRVLNADEINRIQSTVGRIKKLNIEVTINLNK